MKVLFNKLLGPVFVVLAMTMSVSANASLIFDLEFLREGGTPRDIGSIAFASDSGNSVAGLTSFSFNYNIAQPINLGISDIDTINWTIVGGSLTSLLLEVNDFPLPNLGPNGEDSASLKLDFPNVTGSAQLTLPACGGSTLSDTSRYSSVIMICGDTGAGWADFSLVVTPAPVTAASAPNILAIIGLGLFWLARCKRT